MAKTPLLDHLQSLTARALAAPGAGARLSRRELLGYALGAAAVACGPESDPPRAPVDARRVAIVGAGLSGLHCAYRLQQADGGFDVTVYDANERSGGRVFTAAGLFSDKALRCELGGEFIEFEHATMLALAEELDIKLEDRTAAPTSLAPSYFVRGVEVSEEKLLDSLASVGPLLLDTLTSAEHDEKIFRLLDNTSIAGLLEATVSSSKYPELLRLLHVAFRSEFGLETDALSALNLWRLFPHATTEITHLTGTARRRFRAAGGNRAFIDGLTGSFRRIVSDQRLVRVVRTGEGDFELTFVSRSFVGSVVRADQIVFALPFSTLRTVDLSGVPLSLAKQRAIAELAYGNSVKLIGAFGGAPWRERYGRSGDVISDQPSCVAWDSGRGGEQSLGLLTTLLAGDESTFAQRIGVEDCMREALSKLDASLGPVSDDYIDGTAVRMSWPSSPYALGSSSVYRAGQFGAIYKTEGSFERMAGTPNRTLHFCGEHCSLDFKGSMEGAAETGALVAAQILQDFGVPLPALLRPLVQMKAILPQPMYAASSALNLGLGARRALLARTHGDFASALLRRIGAGH